MKKFLLALTLALPLAGCHKTNIVPPPPLVSQVNAFDGQSYRTLMTLQGSLNSLKQSIQGDPTNLSSLKAPLNQAIQDYNIAEQAWKIYHQNQSNQQDVTDSLNKTQTDITALQKGLQ